MSGFFAQLAKLLSLAGVALYGLGWVFVAAMFGRVGLTPAEVGYDFSLIVSRVGTLVFLLLGVVAIPLYSTGAWRWRQDAKQGKMFWFHIVVVGAHIVLLFSVYLALARSLGVHSLDFWNNSLSAQELVSAMLILVLSGCLSVATFALTLRALGYSSTRPIGPSIQYRDSPAEKTVVVLVFVVAALLAAFSLGRSAGDRLTRGEEVRLVLVSVVSVEVKPSEPVPTGDFDGVEGVSSLILGSGDALLLGTSGNQSIFLVTDKDGQRVLRISNDRIVVESRVDNASESAPKDTGAPARSERSA